MTGIKEITSNTVYVFFIQTHDTQNDRMIERVVWAYCGSPLNSELCESSSCPSSSGAMYPMVPLCKIAQGRVDASNTDHNILYVNADKALPHLSRLIQEI